MKKKISALMLLSFVATLAAQAQQAPDPQTLEQAQEQLASVERAIQDMESTHVAEEQVYATRHSTHLQRRTSLQSLVQQFQQALEQQQRDAAALRQRRVEACRAPVENARQAFESGQQTQRNAFVSSFTNIVTRQNTLLTQLSSHLTEDMRAQAGQYARNFQEINDRVSSWNSELRRTGGRYAAQAQSILNTSLQTQGFQSFLRLLPTAQRELSRLARCEVRRGSIPRFALNPYTAPVSTTPNMEVRVLEDMLSAHSQSRFQASMSNVLASGANGQGYMVCNANTLNSIPVTVPTVSFLIHDGAPFVVACTGDRRYYVSQANSPNRNTLTMACTALNVATGTITAGQDAGSALSNEFTSLAQNTGSNAGNSQDALLQAVLRMLNNDAGQRNCAEETIVREILFPTPVAAPVQPQASATVVAPEAVSTVDQGAARTVASPAVNSGSAPAAPAASAGDSNSVVDEAQQINSGN